MIARHVHRDAARFILPPLLFLFILAPVLGQTGDGYRPHQLAPSLRDQAAAAAQKGERAIARDLYLRWLDADPRDHGSWYNLACLYSLDGEKELALDALERSIDAGWKDTAHPVRDPDLEAIRSDARFAAALRRAGARAAVGPRNFVRHYAEMRSRGSFIVMLPPGYDTLSREYPICVILHGSGSSDLGHGRLADTMGREGVIYVAPRAPYPHAELVAAGNLGWTAWPPDRLDAADPNLEQVNARRMKEHGIRPYLIHGEQDNVVPPSTSKRIDELLTEAGLEHSFRLVPGGHTVNGEILTDIRSWVEQEVRGQRHQND